MKTKALVNREIMGYQIPQRTKDYHVDITELVKAGNDWRRKQGRPEFSMREFKRSKTFKDWEVAAKNAVDGQLVRFGHGKGVHTWGHPLFALKIAFQISPEFEVEVMMFHLDIINARENGGDSYNEMKSLLASRHYSGYGSADNFRDEILTVNRNIKQSLGVYEWADATLKQNEMRNNINKTILMFCNTMKDTDNYALVGEAIRQTLMVYKYRDHRQSIIQ